MGLKNTRDDLLWHASENFTFCTYFLVLKLKLTSNVVQSLESTTEKLLTRNTFLLVMSICIEKSKIHSKVRQVEMYVEIEEPFLIQICSF